MQRPARRLLLVTSKSPIPLLSHDLTPLTGIGIMFHSTFNNTLTTSPRVSSFFRLEENPKFAILKARLRNARPWELGLLIVYDRDRQRPRRDMLVLKLCLLVSLTVPMRSFLIVSRLSITSLTLQLRQFQPITLVFSSAVSDIPKPLIFKMTQ